MVENKKGKSKEGLEVSRLSSTENKKGKKGAKKQVRPPTVAETIIAALHEQNRHLQELVWNLHKIRQSTRFVAECSMYSAVWLNKNLAVTDEYAEVLKKRYEELV